MTPFSICRQFYFSPANLQRDFYLRSNMEPSGFVPLKTVANFPRVRMLGLELHEVVEVLQANEFLELKDTDTEVSRILN